jgi:hypothetical protein
MALGLAYIFFLSPFSFVIGNNNHVAISKLKRKIYFPHCDICPIETLFIGLYLTYQRKGVGSK